MTRKERYNTVLAWFRENRPVAETELEYSDPFSLLVAVVLSAQCTDKRVNIITPPLLERFPTPEAMAAAEPEDIYPFIKSCSYPNNKAKHLCGMARKLVSDFGGQVPSDTVSLQSLPGVGRKTAHVIASVVFKQPKLAVDTHVFRVTNRLGLVKATTPLETEKQLVRHIPESQIPLAHHWLILHGRYICQARRPRCEECGLTGACLYYQKLYKEKNRL